MFIETEHRPPTSTGAQEVHQKLQLLEPELEARLPGLLDFNRTYRVITEKTITAMHKGFFRDSAAVDRFDVQFASLYFDPLFAYLQGNRNDVPDAWLLAFDACHNFDLHGWTRMALGVNAHINNDMANALLQSGVDPSFRRDFNRENFILWKSMGEVMQGLTEESGVLNFMQNKFHPFHGIPQAMMLREWRRTAWRDYMRLNSAGEQERESIQSSIQNTASQIGHQLSSVRRGHLGTALPALTQVAVLSF